MPRSYPSFSTSQVIGMLPVAVAAAVALAAALFFALLPEWRLEGLMEAMGLPQLLSAAQPPLGTTARMSLALVAATATGAVTWSALFLLVGPGGVFAPRVRSVRTSGVPLVRRADAHPDAPPRRPLSAAELENEPEDEVSFPIDLDQPLAAFDPHAIPDVPREPIRAIRPGVAVPGERETLRQRMLAAEIRGEPLPIARPERSSSIESLLDRLERKSGQAGSA